MYFLTARKVHLFGIQNEITGKQINYILDENELLNKGVNGTLSLVFDAIKKLGRREKHLKLTCDNAVGQNKNNVTLQFCLYLVIMGCYKSVELNFMIAGHTKFSPDRNFGMIKKKYRKSAIHSKEDFVRMAKESSPTGLNKVQCYEEGRGFQYLSIKEVLEKFFTKLPNIGKYHHFLFESSNLGVVKVKEFMDNWEEFDLWKNKDKIADNVKEIKNLVFPILKPKPLSLERQEYLYKEIRPLLPKKYQDIVCPRLNVDNLGAL